MPLLFNGVCSVVSDRVMGRCLQLSAPEGVSAGTELWKEHALVFSPDELFDDEIDALPEVEVNYELLRLAALSCGKESGNNRSRNIRSKKGRAGNCKGNDLLVNYNQYCEAMTAYKNIASIDTAKNLFQLIAIHVLRDRNDPNLQTIFNSCRSSSTVLSFSQQDLELFDQLGGSKVDACVEDIRKFRVTNPNAIPSSVSDNTAGLYLAILNNNQIELEEVGGSGLFVRSAILEHSCIPNCAFSSNEEGVLRVTAIRDIKPQERLSIDYGNDFYSICSTGYFYLNDRISNSNVENYASKCVSCLSYNVASYLEQCYAKEKEYVDSIIYNKKKMPFTLASINNIIAEKIIHERHFIVFWAFDKLASIETETARAMEDPRLGLERYNNALQITLKGHTLFTDAYPFPHGEHIVYLDKIAQLCVATNNTQQAQIYYERAYEMNVMLSGSDSKTSSDLLQLKTKPPKTLFDLQSFY